ncbi:URC4/urg3 family protein [Leptolyngbya sp. AN02str]|uniref:URC4/urg3 family protein n=1 Tax=Leptolyngbya sp. AN02str TaxID=3423363 RepID=UPI003D31C2FA
MNPQPTALTHAEAIAYLRTPQAIRDRCHQLFDLACADQLQHFRCNLEKLEPTADYVLQVMRASYPDLDVPFHSRWRHFNAGGSDRLHQLDQQLAKLNPLERARAKYDLVIPSVLLDAGAGATWKYREATTGQTLGRSEGLAIASYHMFLQGAFSSQSHQPYQTDAAALEALTEAALSEGFQVSDENPLVGVTGRVDLMRRLGQALRQHLPLFGQDLPRPGHLVDYLMAQAVDHQLPARTVLQAVLEGLSDIWPGRVTLDKVNLGDVWLHSALGGDAPGSNLVPFHKLSQWLTYSLLEPLQELGLEITGLDELTGLAEYRNGGLFVDMGVLEPKHDAVLEDKHLPSSDVIVEWRALTVVLLDQVGDRIRQQLNLSATELPLVKVLEGGTWAAGRKIAAELRPHATPPIQIDSDGTVF